jgi:hypothetical protein
MQKLSYFDQQLAHATWQLNFTRPAGSNAAPAVSLQLKFDGSQAAAEHFMRDMRKLWPGENLARTGDTVTGVTRNPAAVKALFDRFAAKKIHGAKIHTYVQNDLCEAVSRDLLGDEKVPVATPALLALSQSAGLHSGVSIEPHIPEQYQEEETRLMHTEQWTPHQGRVAVLVNTLPSPGHPKPARRGMP